MDDDKDAMKARHEGPEKGKWELTKHAYMLIALLWYSAYMKAF
jgi:hypothetical protein